MDFTPSPQVTCNSIFIHCIQIPPPPPHHHQTHTHTDTPAFIALFTIALHHHATCWLVNIHITCSFYTPLSMVKNAMESIYKQSPTIWYTIYMQTVESSEANWWLFASKGPKLGQCILDEVSPRIHIGLASCLFLRMAIKSPVEKTQNPLAYSHHISWHYTVDCTSNEAKIAILARPF